MLCIYVIELKEKIEREKMVRWWRNLTDFCLPRELQITLTHLFFVEIVEEEDRIEI